MYRQNSGNWSDGSTKPVTKDYYWGQDVDLSSAAQKADYDFLGWNTDSTATEANYKSYNAAGRCNTVRIIQR